MAEVQHRTSSVMACECAGGESTFISWEMHTMLQADSVRRFKRGLCERSPYGVNVFLCHMLKGLAAEFGRFT